MKRVSDTLLGTIERIVFGRSQSHTIPLLKREEFQLLPTNDEVTTSFLTSSSDGKSMELKVNSLPTYDCDPITLEELTDEIVSMIQLFLN